MTRCPDSVRTRYVEVPRRYDRRHLLDRVDRRHRHPRADLLSASRTRDRATPMLSRTFRLLLQRAASLGLLALLVSRVDWERCLPQVARASPCLVLALLVIYAADRVLMALKWRQLLHVLDPRLGPLGAVRVYYESTFVGFAMPLGGLGPDIVRYVRLTKLGIAPHVTLVSMGMERLVGFVATILLAAVGLAVLSALVSGSTLGDFAAAASACALAATSLAAVALFHPRAIDVGERLIARSRRIAHRAKNYVD